jgi:hypothetical protein
MIDALLVLAAATSNPIEVGKFDPSAFPNAVKVDRRMPQEELTARADRILQSGRCSFPGQSVDEYSIDVPYAVLLQPSGEVSKVVVKEVGCPELELLTGEVANELAKARDFRPTKAATEQWYVSEVYYAHGGKAFALTQKDDDRIVCENSKLETGSRLAKSRLCLTKAQWRAYRVEQERLHRDMLVAGANTSADFEHPLRPERGPGDPR